MEIIRVHFAGGFPNETEFASLQFGWRNDYYMEIDSIIAALDAELEKLNQARAVLSKGDNVASSVDRAQLSKPRKATRRVMSLEARKRIAEAQRKRWAATKKTKKSATTVAPKRAAKKAKRPKTADAKKATRIKPALVNAKKLLRKRRLQ